MMEVPGKRRRGRPKRRWLDNIKNDLAGERTAMGGIARPSSMEASHKKYLPHIKARQGAEEEEEEDIHNEPHNVSQYRDNDNALEHLYYVGYACLISAIFL